MRSLSFSRPLPAGSLMTTISSSSRCQISRYFACACTPRGISYLHASTPVTAYFTYSTRECVCCWKYTQRAKAHLPICRPPARARVSAFCVLGARDRAIWTPCVSAWPLERRRIYCRYWKYFVPCHSQPLAFQVVKSKRAFWDISIYWNDFFWILQLNKSRLSHCHHNNSANNIT